VIDGVTPRRCSRSDGPSPLVRFVGLYIALYGAFGVISPFLPDFLHQRGLAAAEIGVVMAFATAVRLVAGPLAGRLADQSQVWRGFLFVCTIGAALAVMLYLPLYGFWALLIVSLVQAAFLAPLAPLADAMAVSASYGRSQPFEYGWVRGAGSGAFIGGAIAAGHAAGWIGIDVIIWSNALLLGVTATAALPLPNIATNEGPSQGESQVDRMWQLLAIPAFRRLLLVSALVLGSHALHDTFAVIHWHAAGIGSGTASLLWSESVASEVLVFFMLGPLLLNRLGPSGAAALAAAAGVLRWTVMGVTTKVAALALVEPLHGFTFALLHLVAMRLIGTTIPLRLAATAQALYGTLAVGAATAIAMFAAGWLYAWIGGTAFWIMAVACVAAIPVTPALGKH
jgi:MFS transporter, PPP family, 3-phenylpropionic acid transporter